ncbi:hypothetical protein KC19_2G174200 [Ceratodon purpureus]|uniref:Uncharacterized protein n=1 Tax=Ceratodon purpureus TaxID=3225 RepID=A0A8T0IXV4_CERPU|nr:hypothetical protein KC19_2G174200 [Ceratodon purpureus]
MYSRSLSHKFGNDQTRSLEFAPFIVLVLHNLSVLDQELVALALKQSIALERFHSAQHASLMITNIDSEQSFERKRPTLFCYR